MSTCLLQSRKTGCNSTFPTDTNLLSIIPECVFTTRDHTPISGMPGTHTHTRTTQGSAKPPTAASIRSFNSSTVIQAISNMIHLSTWPHARAMSALPQDEPSIRPPAFKGGMQPHLGPRFEVQNPGSRTYWSENNTPPKSSSFPQGLSSSSLLVCFHRHMVHSGLEEGVMCNNQSSSLDWLSSTNQSFKDWWWRFPKADIFFQKTGSYAMRGAGFLFSFSLKFVPTQTSSYITCVSKVPPFDP